MRSGGGEWKETTAHIAQLFELETVNGDDLRDLNNLRNQLDALFLHMTHRFQKRQAFTEDGYETAASWLHHELRLTRHEASKVLCAGQAMPQLPQAADAFVTGDISLDHFALIARTIERADLEQTQQADQILTEAARAVDVQTAGRAARYLVQLTRPDEAEKDYQRNFERRMVSLHQACDGVWLLHGQLDQESGATLNTALMQLMPPSSQLERRSATQKRADALTELARLALQRKELGTSGGQRPHLSIVGQDIERTVFELIGAGPIPRSAVERLGCDASISGPDGRESRRIPAALRRQVELRDRHCVHPGCDAPPMWCDVHHIKPWSKGGKTILENLELRCRLHHRAVHLQDDGRDRWDRDRHQTRWHQPMPLAAGTHSGSDPPAPP